MKHLKTYIAGYKTPDDWKSLRARLTSGHDQAAWQEAYSDYYLARLSMRYLEPIKLLQNDGTFKGEGFSIVTIQCSLVEFLETTIQGTSYRFLQTGDTLGPYEYCSSKDVFISFLTTREPFRQHFDTATATAFYKHIRCGLLHEARTKGGWRIWAQSPDVKLIDPINKIIFRDDLQTAFDSFLAKYRNDLLADAALKAAFIRKFDGLCTV